MEPLVDKAYFDESGYVPWGQKVSKPITDRWKAEKEAAEAENLPYDKTPVSIRLKAEKIKYEQEHPIPSIEQN